MEDGKDEGESSQHQVQTELYNSFTSHVDQLLVLELENEIQKENLEKEFEFVNQVRNIMFNFMRHKMTFYIQVNK